MKARVEAGTDIAQIGAWDASRDDGAFDSLSFKQRTTALNEDAAQGLIFILQTGSDGGGPIDVYVDEPVPQAVAKAFELLKGEFLIRIPTGRLVVGGVEDYRYSKRKITGADSVVSVPDGDYRVQCFAPKVDEGSFHGLSNAALKETIGADDYDYWRKREKTAGYGCLPLALLPALAYTFNWKLALAAVFGLVAIWFLCRQQILKRNSRYQTIEERVQELYRQAKANCPPTFIFQLERLQDGSTLKGGQIRLN
jgi:hypothetical protein